MCELIAVAWLVGPCQHRIQHIRASPVRQRANHVVEAHIPCRDVVAALMNVSDEIRKHSLAPIRFNQANYERHGVRSLASSVVLICIGMEKARIEGIFHIASFSCILLGIFRVMEAGCDTLKRL